MDHVSVRQTGLEEAVSKSQRKARKSPLLLGGGKSGVAVACMELGEKMSINCRVGQGGFQAELQGSRGTLWMHIIRTA